MDGFEGFQTSGEEVDAEVVEIAKETQSQVERDDGTELLQCHDKTWADEELLLMNQPREWFSEMESTPGEDTVKSVKMTMKDLGYPINVVAGFERIDSQFWKKFNSG